MGQLGAQSYHVETDETHDDHVKFLVCNNSKHHGLRRPGGTRQGFQRLLPAGFLHGRDVFLLVVSHEGVQWGAAFVFLFIELVNNDANKKVQSEETPEHNEGNEKSVADETVLKFWLNVQLKTNNF